jgi:hypothetical protein
VVVNREASRTMDLKNVEPRVWAEGREVGCCIRIIIGREGMVGCNNSSTFVIIVCYESTDGDSRF